MSASQPAFRGVATITRDQVRRDDKGRWAVNAKPTRAKQPIPNLDIVTDIVAIDAEFQNAYVDELGKEIQRIGRFSIVDYHGKTIYDVFAHYPEQAGYTKTLPQAWRRLGVYWPDIEPSNGARPVAEVEHNIRRIVEGRLVVGHATYNDVGVCSPWVFQGVATRDTQLFEPYREYGLPPQRKPKLSVLAEEVLGWTIQRGDHSSVEDAAATMALYRMHEAEIEASYSGWAMTGGGTKTDSVAEGEGERTEECETEVEAKPATAEEPEHTATAPAATAASSTTVSSVAAAFWRSGAAAVKTAPQKHSALNKPTASAAKGRHLSPAANHHAH